MNAEPGSAGVPPASAKERAGVPRSQDELRQCLQALGFDDVRFASIPNSSPTVPLRAWLAAGMHADMQWMERTADKRLNPAMVLPGARSVIMLGVSYWSEKIR